MYSTSRGDTIVEVLIAIAVISVILVATFTVASQSQAAIRDAEEHGEAMSLLTGQAEAVRPLAAGGSTSIYKPDVFCIDSATGNYVDFGYSPLPSLISDNFSHYPAQCKSHNGTYDYNESVSFDSTTNVFTFLVRWERLTSGRDQAIRFYKISPAAVTPPPPPGPIPPTVTLTANPTSIPRGNISNLTWSSTNAVSCSASSGWSGIKALSGTASTGPLASTTLFKLTCTGPGGSASATATVTVTASPSPFVDCDNPGGVTAGGGYFFDFRNYPGAGSGDWHVYWIDFAHPATSHYIAFIPYAAIILPGKYMYYEIAKDSHSNPLALNRRLHYNFYTSIGAALAHAKPAISLPDTADFTGNATQSPTLSGKINLKTSLQAILVEHGPINLKTTDDGVDAACVALQRLP